MKIRTYSASIHKITYSWETKQYSKHDEILQINAYTAEDAVTQVKVKMESQGVHSYYLLNIEPFLTNKSINH